MNPTNVKGQPLSPGNCGFALQFIKHQAVIAKGRRGEWRHSYQASRPRHQTEESEEPHSPGHSALGEYSQRRMLRRKIPKRLSGHSAR